MVKLRQIPFIALTETWLKPYIHDSQVNIEGYLVSRSDRGTRKGGGVLLYSHHSIPLTQTFSFDDGISQVVVRRFETIKMIICVLYRPPNSSNASLKSCLEFINSSLNEDDDSFELCLMGDFNFPNVDWESCVALPGASLSNRLSFDILYEFIGEHMLSQYITKSTRGENCLDLFFTNSPNLVAHIDTSDTPMSDHRLVDIYFSHNPCQPIHQKPPDFDESFRGLDFSKADYDKINSCLSAIDMVALRELCDDPEDFPDLFTMVILQICTMFCPKKRPPSKKQNTSLRVLSRKKRKIKKQLDRALINPVSTNPHIQSLKRKLALIHANIKDAINQNLEFRENQAVSKVKENSKYFFSYAKRFSKQDRNIPMLFDSNRNISTNPTKIANILQNQFCGVFSNPEDTDITACLFDVPPIDKPFTDDMLEFSISEVIEAIDEIKSTAASGPDGIPVCVLKNCKTVLAPAIHMIWTESLRDSRVLAAYKSSNVSPLHKKDSKAEAANYRPVSLTSHVVKIFERILRKRMVSYLEENGLICSRQHGFRKGKSCLTQLLKHFDDIIDSLQSGNDFDAIYLDYAKAFDKVDHRLLLKKLRLYGFPEKLVQWIKSFLVGRTQQVVVNGYMSTVATIISGVPQGTVLGPILFLIFINDIHQFVQSSIIRCFADDTRLCKSITCESDVIELQNDLDRVIDWSQRNNMQLHEDKFEYLCHSSNSRYTNAIRALPFTAFLFQYSTRSGSDLSPVENLRDLGVIMSHDLSWSHHVGTICNKARQMAGWVLSVFQTRRRDTLLVLYKTLVRSHLEHCSPLWNPTKIGEIQKLEGVQRFFTRKIAGVGHLQYWDRLKALSLMSLQRRRERYIIIHMWKIYHHMTSNDIEVSFTGHNRLGPQAIIPPLRRLGSSASQSIADSSFGILGPKLWNCIPATIRMKESLETFKSALSIFLVSLPDKPPIRGFTSPNPNSILNWRVDWDASALFGGRMC